MPPHSSRPKASSFRELQVWQLAMDHVVEIYQISKAFPPDERFGLTAQIRRAAVSIPTNIAEGNSRFTRPDYRRFVSMAHGSAGEVDTELSIAERLGFVGPRATAAIHDHADVISRMLTNLYRSLED